MRTWPGPLAMASLVAMVPLSDARPPAVTAPTGVSKLKLSDMSFATKQMDSACGQVRNRCRNSSGCPAANEAQQHCRCTRAVWDRRRNILHAIVDILRSAVKYPRRSSRKIHDPELANPHACFSDPSG
jgi:hypothetical protein